MSYVRISGELWEVKLYADEKTAVALSCVWKYIF